MLIELKDALRDYKPNHKSHCRDLNWFIAEKIRTFFPDKVIGGEMAASLVNSRHFSLQLEPFSSWGRQRWGRAKLIESKAMSKRSCWVVYFPEFWAKDVGQVIGLCQQYIEVDGMVLVVSSSEDSSGQEMCVLGDRIYQDAGGHCVMDHIEYRGQFDFLSKQTEILVVATLWQGCQRFVTLDDFLK